MGRVEEFVAASPPGKVAFLITIRALTDFQPGDMVVGYQPDNGHRGALRVREGVLVGRYIDDDDGDDD